MVTLQKKTDVNGNQFTFKWKKKINRLVRKYYVDLITLPSRKVSDESLGRDETSFVRLATKLSQVTVNFTLYC